MKREALDKLKMRDTRHAEKARKYYVNGIVDGNNNYGFFNILKPTVFNELQNKDTSFGELLADMTDFKLELRTLQDNLSIDKSNINEVITPKKDINMLNDKVNEIRKELKDFLRTNGYNSMPNTFNDLFIEINDMYVLNPKQDHYIAIKDLDGYVIGVRKFKTDDIFKCDIPEDLNLGYYKLINGEFIVDEKLKEDITSLD